jgi:uncharacterized membrane protein YoaK (UPF0700 family)
MTRRLAERRTVLVRTVTTFELVLLAAALVTSWVSGSHLGAVVTGALAAVAAIAMGAQNATARHLAVPDLTTTVLTMTLTGIAADVRSRKGAGAIGRRLLAVLTMFGGALAAVLAWTTSNRGDVASQQPA